MQVAVLTFDGFNELDSFVAAAILNRLRLRGWVTDRTMQRSGVPGGVGVAENGLRTQGTRGPRRAHRGQSPDAS